MTEIERLAAVEAIKTVKAKYFRGLDTNDTEMVRAILAEDCVLDMRGCCTDPASGRDFFPEMNVVLRGRESWSAALGDLGIVSVHQGHTVEIEVDSETTARAVWGMTDRLYFPPGGPFAVMTGYGHYHETYEKSGGAWRIKTSRIARLRVEAA